ncbi:unnamed protein product, partial [Taenia asiatica]|uniref:Uncharacterized protein n=1 Tax=Taenia asiatica TaxID=60517 RepID=A0A0R3WGE2_TAEAS
FRLSQENRGEEELVHRQPTPSPPRHVEASSQTSMLAQPRSCLLFTNTAETNRTPAHTVTTNAACGQATMPTSVHPTVPTSTDKNMANFPTLFTCLPLLSLELTCAPLIYQSPCLYLFRVTLMLIVLLALHSCLPISNNALVIPILSGDVSSDV